MINDKLVSAINAQISKEFYSAYFYLSMVAFFSESGLNGFAKWTHKQAQEEIDHGMKMFDYIIERDAKVELFTIDAPETRFSSALDIFQKAFAHEQEVTESIHEISKLAFELDDAAAKLFFDHFIVEQVEEESKFRNIIERLKLFGDDCTSLYLLDRELNT